MSHLMARGGGLCGKRDGHGGPHRSPEGMSRNRERQREWDRENRAANRDRMRERDREYNAANRDRRLEYNAVNRERIREYRADPARRFRWNLLRDIRNAKKQLEALENGDS